MANRNDQPGQQGNGENIPTGHEQGYGNDAYNSGTDRNFSPDENREDWGRARVDTSMGDEDHSFDDHRFGQAAEEGRFGSDTNKYNQDAGEKE